MPTGPTGNRRNFFKREGREGGKRRREGGRKEGKIHQLASFSLWPQKEIF